MNLWAVIVIICMAYTRGVRIVCYHRDYRYSEYTPISNVPPCTHVIYSFVVLQGTGVYKLPSNVVAELTSLKRKQITVLLAVGDFMDKPETFFTLVFNANTMNAFARNLTSYIRELDFGGAVMEWANLAGKPNPRYEKARFLFLLMAIRKEFNEDAKRKKKPALILSVTLPAVKRQIDSGYSLLPLVRQTDFITIRTLDLRTADDKKVGLSAPLRSDPNSVGDDRLLSVDWITKYFISLKVPKDKINIGIPTYGRSFKLKDYRKNTIGAAAIAHGDANAYIKMVGIASYYEICKLIWVGGSVQHVASQGGRYYTNGYTWISYEDALSVSQKTCFVRKMGLGGITFWTLALDDHSGKYCSQGTFPMIRTAVNLMTYKTDPYVCKTENLTGYVDVPPTESEFKPNYGPIVMPPRPYVVCYYTNWSQYRNGLARFLPENIDHTDCSHIVYGYAVIDKTDIVPYLPNDESKPWLEGMYGRVLRRKKYDPQLLVLLGVGGGDAGLNAFEYILENYGRVARFSRSADTFLRARKFDGIELTWHWPSLRRSNMFMHLIVRLRIDLGRSLISESLIVALAMPCGKGNIDSGFKPIISVVRNVDLLNLQTYDFNGNWSKFTGHNSPMYAHKNEVGAQRYYNVNWVAKYYISLGLPKEKMTIGIPTYGRSFTLQNPKKNYLRAPVVGPGKAGRYTATKGLLACYEVVEFINSGATVVWSESQKAYHAFKGDQWVGYETSRSVRTKACYARYYKFGGINVRTLDYDIFNFTDYDAIKIPLVYHARSALTSGCKWNDIWISESNAERNAPGSGVLYFDALIVWTVVRICLT